MDNAALVKTFSDWEERAQKRWNPTFDSMKKDDRLYNSQINYDKAGKKPWQTKIIIPAAFRSIQTILSIVKDYLPGTDILPREENDVEFQEMIQLRFDHEADRMKFDRVKMDAMEDMLRLKDGIVKITWEEDRCVAEVLNPIGGVLFDEMATSVETASYVIIRYPMRIRDIKREKGFDATADAKINEVGLFEPFDNQQTGDAGARTTVEKLNSSGSAAAGGETYAPGGSENLPENNYAFVKDVWYSDPDTGEEMYAEWINSTITSKPKIQDETGKWVEGGERGPVSNDVNAPWGYGRKPIFLGKNYGSKHSLYGNSETELTKSIDLANNEVNNSIVDWIRKAANPPRYVLRSFFQGAVNRFRGKDSEEIPVNRPDEVGFLELPPAPVMASKYAEDLRFMHDNIGGVKDVASGQTPGQVTSGIAIAELQEAAQTTIRYKVGNELSDMIEDMSKFILFLILKFDTSSMTLVKEDGDGNRDFKEWDAAIFREDIGFLVDKMESWEDTPFNIKVRSGQQQPQTRAERLSRAEKLFEVGIYGIEDVARELGLPDSGRVIQRFYERQGWSPEAVTALAEDLLGQINADPENEIAQAQMAILNQVFPSIVGQVLKEAQKAA